LNPSLEDLWDPVKLSSKIKGDYAKQDDQSRDHPPTAIG
jgi:hypothetical protein